MRKFLRGEETILEGNARGKEKVLFKKTEEIDMERFLGLYRSGDAPRKKHFGG